MEVVVPRSLRVWFIIHFFVDMVFAIPLMLFPVGFLTYFGVEVVEVTTARLVAAALIAIGGTSLLAPDMQRDTFVVLLTLKLLWSAAAIWALTLTLLTSFNIYFFIVLAIFVAFFFLWAFYKLRLMKI